MKVSRGILYALIYLFLLSPIYGQSKAWDLYTFKNEKFTGVLLNKVENDVLFININNKIHALKVDSIRILKYENKSYATLLGTIAGIVIGGYLSNQFRQKISADARNSGFKIAISSGVGMLLGGIVGYNSGKAFGGYKSYDFYRIKNKESKIKLILKLIKEN